MLFAVCSDRGAPGATTLALALAAARGLPSVVVEADPYGGDLAVRCRINGDPLPPTPTVLGLGAGMSASQAAQMVASYGMQHGRQRDGANEARRLDLWRDGSHLLSDLVGVVPGFLTAEQGATLSWASVAATVEAQLVPVFADLGRIHTGSPSMPIAMAADALVTVCRGDVASVQHMIWRLEQLVPAIAECNGRPPVVIAIVVAPRRNGSRAAGQVTELLAETKVGPTVCGVGWLAWDPAAVAHLVEGGDPWERPLRTSPLLKSARSLMGLLGEATGLDHADPYAEAKRARRTRKRDPQAENPQSGGHAARDQDAAMEVRVSLGSTTSFPASRTPGPENSVVGPVNDPANGHVNGNGSGPSFEGLRRRPVDAREGGE
jgi:hypothetical protein